MPKVSILIAARNAEATIVRTLDSLREQTETDWQAIVVENGSIDSTLAVARGFAETDSRIHVESREGGTAASARNAAAALAEADWLLPLDADDFLAPAALEAQLAFIAGHPGYSMYLWGQTLCLPGGEERPAPAYRGAGVREYGFKDLAFQRAHIGASLFWRKGLFDRLGGYREFYAEDYDLVLRAAMSGAVALRNPERLQFYRVGAGSKTGSGFDKHAESIRAVIADAESHCSEGPNGCRQVLAAARREFTSAQARDEFRTRLTVGDTNSLRGVYLQALDRERSWSDKWLWAAPAALLWPRLVRPFLGRG